MPTSVELREERAALVSQARDLQKRAETEARELTSEESEQFDRIMADVDGLRSKIDRIEKLESAEADLDAPEPRASQPFSPEARDRRDEARAAQGDEARQKADFRHWMLTGEVREGVRPNARAVAEYRDTIVGTDSKGGYLIAPVRLTADIVKAVDNQVFMRRLARIDTVTDAKKLGIRKLSARMADADWNTEVQPVAEDTTMAFDRRDLEPFKCSKLAKVSNRTLALSTDAEGIIRDELAYAFAITQEKAFLTGNGTAKPLGVFTASASGIPTGRDVSTGNTTTAIGADNLFEVLYSINSGYLNGPSVGWIFHRDAVKQVRKLKTTDNQYLWQPGLQQGQPDSLLGYPVYMSEYAPNTFTTGLYVGLFGNFAYYRIAQLNVMFLQRLVELYAATDEVGFIGRMWADGAPLLDAAFARVKLA